MLRPSDLVTRSAECPATVGARLTPFVQHWRSLSFIHLPVDPADVQRRIPSDLRVDVAAGTAWVSIVPFILSVRALGFVPAGRLLTFPEINVRTYVVGPDGNRGIWFLSLYAPHLVVNWAALLTYGLPYRWAQVRAEVSRHRRAFSVQFPLHKTCARRIEIHVGQPISEPNLTPLDLFLTARWRLYHKVHSRVCFSDVEHKRWALAGGSVTGLDENLLAAWDLPRVLGIPTVHCADSTTARFSWPRLAARNDGSGRSVDGAERG